MIEPPEAVQSSNRGLIRSTHPRALHLNSPTFKHAQHITDRWLNQLNPNVKKEPFSGEEDAIIMAAHTILGNKWASISKLLVGR